MQNESHESLLWRYDQMNILFAAQLEIVNTET